MKTDNEWKQPGTNRSEGDRAAYLEVLGQLGIVNAGTIIGAVIKTAKNGQRIELSQSSIKAYDASENLIWSISNTGVWTINPGAITTDQGDPSSWPFRRYWDGGAFQGNLTNDGNWHDMDLSSYVTLGHKRIFFRYKAQRGSSINADSFYIRKKGSTNDVNQDGRYYGIGQTIAVTPGLDYGMLEVGMNSNYIVEYNINFLSLLDIAFVVTTSLP